MHLSIFRSRGAEDAEDVVLGKIVLTTGILIVVVRGHAAGAVFLKDLLSQETRDAVVQHVHRNDIELFHVIHNAVVSTVRGRGTPGVRATVAECRNKPERCVLHETQVVGEWLVQVNEVKHEDATLECKLRSFPVLFTFARCSLECCRSSCFFNFLARSFLRTSACFCLHVKKEELPANI